MMPRVQLLLWTANFYFHLLPRVMMTVIGHGMVLMSIMIYWLHPFSGHVVVLLAEKDVCVIGSEKGAS
ncbi:hypothetical protein VNO77_39469 [Canavalia gladiata]|uniref:Uncharacterized protein n=1 Tax=Canavalia gladiata TaxID=3824 RepID=A0AAN9PVU4_CANGL